MKCYRIVNYSDGGRLATPLHFLDRGDAQRYFKTWAWPWEPIGAFIASDGHSLPLSRVELRIEPVSLKAWYAADLEWVVIKKDEVLGYFTIVPGRCFDPEDWRPLSDIEQRDPVLAPKIAEAARNLEEELKRTL